MDTRLNLALNGVHNTVSVFTTSLDKVLHTVMIQVYKHPVMCVRLFTSFLHKLELFKKYFIKQSFSFRVPNA